MDELRYAPPQAKHQTPSVDAVRAFVFLSGQRWMKDHGVFERFEDLLPLHLREGIRGLIASEWVGLDDALAVYAACDGLGLSAYEQIELGRVVSKANNGVFMNTIARLAGTLGVSPWVALESAQRTWLRSNRGGAVAVFQTGEKAARLEFWQVPLARSPFFITSMRGALAVGLEPFCKRALVVDLPEYASEDGFAMRLAW